MKPGARRRPRAAFERALEIQPGTTRPPTAWVRCWRRSGDVPARDRALPQAALAGPTRLPRRAQQPRLRALPDRPGRRRPSSSTRRRSRSSPTSREALNNLGIFFGRQGDLDRARTVLPDRRSRTDPGYGEAANNLALVLARAGRRRRRDHACCKRLLARQPRLRDHLRDAVAHLPARRAAGARPSRCWSCSCRGTRRTPPRSRRCRSSAAEASGWRLAGPPALRPGSSSPRSPCTSVRRKSRPWKRVGQPRVVDARAGAASWRAGRGRGRRPRRRCSRARRSRRG